MADSLLSHIGIAVSDLEAAIPAWSLLTGDSNPFIEDVPDQRVKVAIFSQKNTSGAKSHGRVELVAATAPESPIAKFIARKGEGLHHICIYVDDIEKKMSELKANGVKLIDEIPRIGAEGKRIAFVHPVNANGVLIELEER
jgi:methylmalonyl-CoA/ethylmalonyl-CoA epimerase